MARRLSRRQAGGHDLDAAAADVRWNVLLQIDRRLMEVGRRLGDFGLALPPATTGDDGDPIAFLGEAPPAAGNNPAARLRELALASELPADTQALLDLVAQREPTLQSDQRVA